MSKAGCGQVLANVSLAPRAGRLDGFIRGSRNWRPALPPLRMRRYGCRQIRPKPQETEAMTWLAYPPWLNAGRQRVADDRCDARRADEPARPGGPVRRGDAEALVGQQHDAHVRRVLRSCWSRGCLWAFKMGFGTPIGTSGGGFFGTTASSARLGNRAACSGTSESRARR